MGSASRDGLRPPIEFIGSVSTKPCAYIWVKIHWCIGVAYASVWLPTCAASRAAYKTHKRSNNRLVSVLLSGIEFKVLVLAETEKSRNVNAPATLASAWQSGCKRTIIAVLQGWGRERSCRCHYRETIRVSDHVFTERDISIREVRRMICRYLGTDTSVHQCGLC